MQSRDSSQLASSNTRSSPCNPESARTAHEEAVPYVLLEFVDLNVLEAGIFEHLDGSLMAPHGAESLPVLGERYGHAKHTGDRVQDGTEGMIGVYMQVA